MHALQPKHTKLKKEEVDQLLKDFNVGVAQLPKILTSDNALPAGCVRGDVVKIERKIDDKTFLYYRVVV